MPSSGGQTCALRSEEHTSELQSHDNLVCRLLLEKNERNRLRIARRHTCPIASHRSSHAVLLALARPIFHKRVLHAILILVVPFVFFFFNDTATTEIYTLSLHDALPILNRHLTTRCRLRPLVG